MRDYELVVILNPQIPEENVPPTIEKISQLITARGGTIADVKQWGKRKLAYPIKRFAEGNYVLTHFKLDPKLGSDLEANLLLSEDVIRHLLVRIGD